MTDYYPLIGKAVAGLEKNTGEARRVLYERARTALVGQLRNMNPPLTESEITRERLALEEAIRKVEAEAARRLRMEPPRPDTLSGVRPGAPAPNAPTPSAPPSPPAPSALAADAETARRAAAPPPPPMPAPAPSPRREAAPPRREPPPPPRREAAAPPPSVPPPPPPRASDEGPPPEATEEPRAPEPQPTRGRNRVFGERAPLTDEGLKGFRDVVAEVDALGEKTAQATRNARQAYASVPTDVPELDRVEPRMEPTPLRRDVSPPREAPPPPPPPRQPEPQGARQPERPPPPPRPPSRQPHGGAALGGPPLGDGAGIIEPARSRKGLVAVLLTLFVILGIGMTAYVMRDRIAALTGAMRGLAPQAQRDAAPSRPKITDRVGQDGQPTTPSRPGQQQPPPGQQALPAVAQRVVLYEEDPADPNGKRYIGSAVWRTETVSPGSGQAPELAVRCDVEIPERRLAMTLSMRRNTDQTLPASHTVEIMFNLPADFPFGGISNVPGILMKQAEQTRGAPLSGLAVKVTSGFFLLGLSAVDSEKERNLQLLKERAWFDVPVVYNNGRRAIIAVEKGNPGERVFKEAFAAWGQ